MSVAAGGPPGGAALGVPPGFRAGLLAVLSLSALGCSPQARFAAAEGTATGPANRLSIDEAKTPVLRSCPSGQTIQRREGGFSCVPLSLEGVSAARLADLSAAADTLERRVAALETSLSAATASITAAKAVVLALDSALQRYTEDTAAQPFSVAAITCSREPEELADGLFREAGGFVSHASGLGLDAHLYCPLYGLDPLPKWNTFDMVYHAPDPPSAEVDARVAFLSFDLAGGRIEHGFTTTSRLLDTGFVTATSKLYGFASSVRDPNHIDSAHYNTGREPPQGILGFFARKSGPFSPPELARAGGVLRLSAAGRRAQRGGNEVWLVDEAYLAPDHRETQFLERPRPVDGSRLAHPVPAFVLDNARTCNCALQYALDVPPGRYRVTYYAAEICLDCATIGSDGSIVQSPAPRSQRARLLEQLVPWIPADAALPPDQDRRGAYDMASELTLTADLSEGPLLFGIERDVRNTILSGIVIERVE